MAPPLCSAFARTVARTAVAAEFTATSTGAITGTAAEFTATTSTALTAIRAFAAVFAARLLSAGGRNEDGLIRHAEQGGELALQRGPEADGGLDRDDDGLNLDTRTVFTTRAVFTTRTTVAFRARTAVAFEARTTIAFGARAAVAFTARTTIAFGAGFATWAVALRDAGLAAFFDGAFGAAFTRFTAGTRLAFGARFTTFTRFTLLALFRGVLLGEGTSEVLGQLRRIFDDATGWAGSLTIGGRRSGATRRTTATELLRRRDGTGLGGGFGRGPDH